MPIQILAIFFFFLWGSLFCVTASIVSFIVCWVILTSRVFVDLFCFLCFLLFLAHGARHCICRIILRNDLRTRMMVAVFLFRVSEGMARVGEKPSSNLCVQLRLLFHRGGLHGLLLLTMLSAFRHTLGVQKEWRFPLGEPHVSGLSLDTFPSLSSQPVLASAHQFL